MDLFIYNQVEDDLQCRILDAISQAGISDGPERFSSPVTFISRLYRPKQKLTVAIIVIRDKDEVDCISQYFDMLMGLKIILVAPQHGNGMSVLSRMMHARLVLAAHEDLTPIAEMLRKLKAQDPTEDSAPLSLAQDHPLKTEE
ncbi:hypothetical protein JXA32_07870 [Candidatus Sumerlaeota bacterium]|nr:hypothetical protein [Candidatus Sumerlaeota bacterium]